jgi:hypothetical protein
MKKNQLQQFFGTHFYRAIRTLLAHRKPRAFTLRNRGFAPRAETVPAGLKTAPQVSAFTE